MLSVNYLGSAAGHHGKFRLLSGGTICLISALVVVGSFFAAAYVYFA